MEKDQDYSMKQHALSNNSQSELFGEEELAEGGEGGDRGGVGHGDKKQIHMMVKVLMPKATFDSDDAADAIAIAICHGHHRQSAAARAAFDGAGRS